jgi:hypothetical protein
VTEPLLDRQALERAFTLLGEKLKRRHVIGEVFIFGGAAMVMAYDARRATRDVDALFSPDGPVLESVREVARELNLPNSWLNNQASSYVSSKAGTGRAVFDHPNLRVLATPPEHLLAMKVRAARAVRDADDIRILLDRLELRTVDQVLALVSNYFPDEPLSDRSRMMLEDIIAEQT